jgi:glutathione S-transferase
MITVHHLNFSRSQRVLWLLEELGLPYTVQPWQRDAQTLLAPPGLREVHPLGRSPVIADGDLVMAESGAILEYFAEREGSALAPAPGSPDRARYLYWMHYAEGSLMPPLFLKRLFDRIEATPVPFFLKSIPRRIAAQGRDGFVLPQLRRHLAFIEGELAHRPWFAGDAFSAADIQMSYPLEVAQQRIGLQDYPRAQSLLARACARPAYQRARERGGAFGVP